MLSLLHSVWFKYFCKLKEKVRSQTNIASRTNKTSSCAIANGIMEQIRSWDHQIRNLDIRWIPTLNEERKKKKRKRFQKISKNSRSKKKKGNCNINTSKQWKRVQLFWNNRDEWQNNCWNPNKHQLKQFSLTIDLKIEIMWKRIKKKSKKGIKRKQQIRIQTPEIHWLIKVIPPIIKTNPLSPVMVIVYIPERDGWMAPDQAIAKLIRRSKKELLISGKAAKVRKKKKKMK